MTSAKRFIFDGLFVALLIVSQLALSGLSGIEIVTVLFLSFCFKRGIKDGLLVANAFSLLRCILFGFYINVIALYLIYYNAFALLFGWLGNALGRKYSIKTHLIIILSAIVMTALFTLLDNLLTPLILGYTQKALRIYFIASLYTLFPQLLCTLVTTTFIFPALIKILR